MNEIGTSFKVGQPPQRSFTDYVNAQDFGRQVRREGASSTANRGLSSAAQFLFDR